MTDEQRHYLASLIDHHVKLIVDSHEPVPHTSGTHLIQCEGVLKLVGSTLAILKQSSNVGTILSYILLEDIKAFSNIDFRGGDPEEQNAELAGLAMRTSVGEVTIKQGEK